MLRAIDTIIIKVTKFFSNSNIRVLLNLEIYVEE